jgi:hypothetical protein
VISVLESAFDGHLSSQRDNRLQKRRDRTFWLALTRNLRKYLFETLARHLPTKPHTDNMHDVHQLLTLLLEEGVDNNNDSHVALDEVSIILEDASNTVTCCENPIDECCRTLMDRFYVFTDVGDTYLVLQTTSNETFVMGKAHGNQQNSLVLRFKQ